MIPENTWGYISVDSLLAYCENSTTHSITPNDFMRMNRFHVSRCRDCARSSDHTAEGTSCPIEEHYALPADGYCHLFDQWREKDDCEE